MPDLEQLLQLLSPDARTALVQPCGCPQQCGHQLNHLGVATAADCTWLEAGDLTSVGVAAGLIAEILDTLQQRNEEAPSTAEAPPDEPIELLAGLMCSQLAAQRHDRWTALSATAGQCGEGSGLEQLLGSPGAGWAVLVHVDAPGAQNAPLWPCSSMDAWGCSCGAAAAASVQKAGSADGR